MTETKTRIVVVGGGFGGVKAALELARCHELFDITLVSDRPNFRYYPTLYHTATGGRAAQSSIPLVRLFEGSAVRLAVGEITQVDRQQKTVIGTDGTRVPYDILVVALGSITNFFGIKGLEEYSYGIKSVGDAMRFKAHLHEQLASEHKPDLNYVVVGGGPTGIELAGSLPAYLRHIMQAHGVAHRKIHVDLVEAAPQLLPRMPKRIGQAVAERLRKLGVSIYLNQKVEGETADSLMVNGQPIKSRTVVWTAGVANHPFFKANHFTPNERGNKVKVDQYLQAEKDIYVIGDNADTPYSGLAQTALHDALFVAGDIKRAAKGRPRVPYKPKRPITVIPVGHGWAAVQWGRLMLFGWVGWLLRLAADARAFAGYEPWWKAGEQWMTEFDTEEACPTCAKEQLR